MNLTKTGELFRILLFIIVSKFTFGQNSPVATQPPLIINYNDSLGPIQPSLGATMLTPKVDTTHTIVTWNYLNNQWVKSNLTTYQYDSLGRLTYFSDQLGGNYAEYFWNFNVDSLLINGNLHSQVWKSSNKDSVGLFDYSFYRWHIYDKNDSSFLQTYGRYSSISGQLLIDTLRIDSLYTNKRIIRRYQGTNSIPIEWDVQHFSSLRVDSLISHGWPSYGGNRQTKSSWDYNSNGELISLSAEYYINNWTPWEYSQFYNNNTLDSILFERNGLVQSKYTYQYSGGSVSSRVFQSLQNGQLTPDLKITRCNAKTYNSAIDTLYIIPRYHNGISFTDTSYVLDNHDSAITYQWIMQINNNTPYNLSFNNNDTLIITNSITNHAAVNGDTVKISCIQEGCYKDTVLKYVVIPYNCSLDEWAHNDTLVLDGSSSITVEPLIYNPELDTTFNAKFDFIYYNPGWGWYQTAQIIGSPDCFVSNYSPYNLTLDTADIDIDDDAIWIRRNTNGYCGTPTMNTKIYLRWHTCLDSIISHPINDTTFVGQGALFNLNHGDSAASFQWQSLINGVWLNLLDTGSVGGSNSSVLSISQVGITQNNSGYRCLINSCVNDTSAIAYLIVKPQPCQDSITTQPQSNTFYTVPGSAYFKVDHTDTNATYQWQQNVGTGWTNLSDFGFYTGTSTDSLQLSGITFAINGVGFRCLTQSCENDTSNIAILTVIDNVGIEESSKELTVAPNPTSGLVSVNLNSAAEYNVFNMTGQKVAEGKTEGKIDLTNLPSGTYQLILNTDEGISTHTIQKL